MSAVSILLVPSPLKGIGRATRRKLQGLGLIVVVAGLLALTVAIYNKAFSTFVTVTLQVSRIGHQLVVPADVKVRGVLVGQVRAVHTGGKYATMTLDLDPAKVDQIPANVSAMILPKTLFGEKYVDLVIPAHPSAQHIYAGEVIPEDRSSVAIETEQVFNDLVPLLQSLQPVQLNLTLSAMADALSGRGNELGDNLVRADQYFAAFNPHLSTFDADISGLADLATNYAEAAPNLLTMARNFSYNARTMVEKADVFAALLQNTTTFSQIGTTFFQQDGNDMIELAQVSLPTLGALARYSPEFTCLLTGIAAIQPLISSTFTPPAGSHPELHITVQVLSKQPNGYTFPGDYPAYNQDPGPKCYTLPNAPAPPGIQPPSSFYPPGQGPDAPNPSPVPGGSPTFGPFAPASLVGSPADRAAVAAVTAPLLQEPATSVPSFTDLLAGPMLRGMEVSYS